VFNAASTSSSISKRQHVYIWLRWCLYCTGPTRWVWIFREIAHWISSPRSGRHVAPFRYVILTPSQTTLLPNASRLGEKQPLEMLLSLVLPIGDRTHDIPHSRRVC